MKPAALLTGLVLSIGSLIVGAWAVRALRSNDGTLDADARDYRVWVWFWRKNQMSDEDFVRAARWGYYAVLTFCVGCFLLGLAALADGI